jgi:DNA repair exonuclease SbcCD nuclease subunit
MKILACSDAHYGLKSAGFDRTEETHAIMKKIVQRAISEDVDLFVHCGDLGHTANPSSNIHALWTELYLELDLGDILSRFLVGNHDVVHRAHMDGGSLRPLNRINLIHVSGVSRPTVETFVQENGMECAVVFLPFLSKSQVPSDIDTYLVDFLEQNEAIIKQADCSIAFTHLNPDGAEVGDDRILRAVHSKVPDQLYGMVDLICSGHIHKPQELQRDGTKHYIIGSPICTDFGDMYQKRFLTFETDTGSNWTVESVPTGSTPLVSLEYDFTGDSSIDFGFDGLENEIEAAGLKVAIRITEDQRELIDPESVRNELIQRGAKFVRPIVPTVIRCDDRARVLTDPTIDDSEAIAQWISAKKPTNADRITRFAGEALEQG